MKSSNLTELTGEKLTDAQMEQYREQGYLAFEGVLSPEEVADSRAELRSLIERPFSNAENGEWNEGRPMGKNNHSGPSYKMKENRSFFQLESKCDWSGLSADELELKVRKFMWFEEESAYYQKMVQAHKGLFSILDSLFPQGVELYQSMALVKPPFIGSEKPWHQDNAYFSIQDPNGTIGIWIALDDAKIENGCMHVLPGGHKKGPLKHVLTFDCEIEKDRFDPSEMLPVPVKAGGALFFHGNLPHWTPVNSSDSRRRALQFHYRAVDNPIIPAADYNEVFVEADGSPATCAAAVPENF